MRLLPIAPCLAVAVLLAAPTSSPAQATTSGIDLASSQGGAIAGRVTSTATGGGVPNAYIRIFGSAGIEVASNYADGTGNYQVSGLLPGTYYAVSENDQGLIDELYDDIPCPALSCSATSGSPIVVVAGATTSGVDFALARGGRIAGSITSAGSGMPIAGALLAIYDAAGVHLGWSDPSDAAGRYRLGTGLPPGTYRARTSNESGFIDELFDDIPCPGGGCSVSPGTPIVVAAGVTTSGIDFALDTGGRMAGRITSAASGAPLGGIYVGVYASTGNHVGWSSPTDAAGSYLTPALLPGTYFAETLNYQSFTDEIYDDIPCPSGSCSVTSGSPIVVTAEATTSGIDFALDPPPGTSFYTLAPCRVIDSRVPGDPFGTALAAGEERPLSLAGRCGISASAKAVALNVTVTAPTAQGHLILYPQQRPTASTVNFEPGLTRASNAVIGLNAQGGAFAYFGPPNAAGTVHLVIDVAGYFE